MFITRFTAVSDEVQDYYYQNAEDAEKHLNLFLDDTSGLYRNICVMDADGSDIEKKQLLADQNDKCYLCERKRDTDFEIEHHKSAHYFPRLVQDWNNCFGFPPIFVLTMTIKEPNANIIKISDTVIQKVLKIKQIASGKIDIPSKSDSK